MNRAVIFGIASALCILSADNQPSHAQAAPKVCTSADNAAVIADMSTKLRQNNKDNQNRMTTRLRELAKLRNWTEAESEEKGLDLLEDDQTQSQDETASHLLAQIDQLSQTTDAALTCTRVQELKQLAAQLIEVTSAKASHLSAKLDTELKGARIAQPSIPKLPAPQPTAPAPPTEQKKTAPAVIPDAPRPVAKAAPDAPPNPPPQTAPKLNDAYSPPLASASPAPAVAVDAATLEFSVDDIRAAGRGLFGTLSAELAGVIEYTFKSFGRPNGYILGTEGGAALLAGLRYGDGMLVTKFEGERKVYWQGPSVGYDFGLTGSRTMILVYGLVTSEDIHQRFGGIDGSAYLVGGAGVTVLKKGPMVLAPIRTGVGLRLGANIGYLRFTPRPRFNPF
jgi:hypothetical protein